MTEEYRRLLGAAGYHELALGIRMGILGVWDEPEIPLSDLSVEELKERAECFWNLLKKPQTEGMGLLEMQERLRLSEKELYLVFLASLWWVHDDFWPLLMKIEFEGQGISSERAGMLMEMIDRKQTETAVVDIGRMRRFVFSDFGTVRWLRLAAVMADHFAAGDIAPLWWRMGTDWFRSKGEMKEIAGIKRRELAVRLAEYMEAGNELLFLDGEPGSGRRFLTKRMAEILGRDLLFVSLTPEFAAEKGAAGIVVREALLGQGWPVIVCTPETEYGEMRLFLQELEYRCKEEALPLIVIGYHGWSGIFGRGTGAGLWRTEKVVGDYEQSYAAGSRCFSGETGRPCAFVFLLPRLLKAEYWGKGCTGTCTFLVGGSFAGKKAEG